MIKNRHLPTEYAKLFNLSPKADNESPASFRERVARELADLGEMTYAHEALHNDRMGSDPFSGGSLDRGLGDDFITETAKITEATYLQKNGTGKEGMLKSLFPRFSKK